MSSQSFSPTLAPGTQVSVAAAYSDEVVIEAASNVAECVIRLAAEIEGLEAGKFLELVSGWPGLNAQIARVKAVAQLDVTLEGVDTRDKDRYPEGAGVGSARMVTGWLPVSMLTRDYQVSGGKQRYADASTLDDIQDKEVPTTREPIKVSFPFYDDVRLPWYARVKHLSDEASPAGVLLVFTNRTRLVANARWSMQEVPTNQDSTMRSSIDLAFVARPRRYTN